MTCDILPEAASEAVAAAIWYENQRQGLGQEFLNELQNVYESLKRQVSHLPRMEQYEGPYEIRRCLLRRFPYAVIVQSRESGVLVIAVAHTRRRPFYWLRRLS